jgi:hypothetical protein
MHKSEHLVAGRMVVTMVVMEIPKYRENIQISKSNAILNEWTGLDH